MLGSAFVECSTIGLLLEGGNWSYTALRYIDFSKSDLSGINWEGADLSGCDFTSARLTGCCLRQAVVHQAIFKKANLCGADIDGTDLLSASSIKEARIDLDTAVLLAEQLGFQVELGGN